MWRHLIYQLYFLSSMRGDFQLSSANVTLNEPLNVPFNADLNEIPTWRGLLSGTLHYVSACGIRPKTQFWLFQHIRHSEGALGCKTKVPSWIFDFHQFSGAHWGGWSEPIRDLFVTFLKMCAISIISVWRPNMVSLWSFIVFTSPSVNNFSYLWQNIQILSQTLTKT